jgi:hypothetical protein
METHYDHLNKKTDRLQQQRQQKKNREGPNHSNQDFYPRIKNLTNIRFNDEELQLLNYGLNYSVEKPTTSYLTELIAETERAIKLLDEKLQNTYRFLKKKTVSSQPSRATDINTD